MDANENGGMLSRAIRSSRLISPISLRQQLNTMTVLNSFHFLLSHAWHVGYLSYGGKTALSKHPALVTTAARRLDGDLGYQKPYPANSQQVPLSFKITRLDSVLSLPLLLCSRLGGDVHVAG